MVLYGQRPACSGWSATSGVQNLLPIEPNQRETLQHCSVRAEADHQNELSNVVKGFHLWVRSSPNMALLSIQLTRRPRTRIGTCVTRNPCMRAQ